MTSKQIQNLFQAPKTAIASYDYFDIAEGTGINIFYLLRDYSGYSLSKNQIDSGGKKVESVYSCSTVGSVTLRGTENFDLKAFESASYNRNSVFRYNYWDEC